MPAAYTKQFIFFFYTDNKLLYLLSKGLKSTRTLMLCYECTEKVFSSLYTIDCILNKSYILARLQQIDMLELHAIFFSLFSLEILFLELVVNSVPDFEKPTSNKGFLNEISGL